MCLFSILYDEKRPVLSMRLDSLGYGFMTAVCCSRKQTVRGLSNSNITWLLYKGRNPTIRSFFRTAVSYWWLLFFYLEVPVVKTKLIILGTLMAILAIVV